MGDDRAAPRPRATLAIYRALLWLYPAAFRRAHSEEMVGVVEDEWTRRVEEPGRTRYGSFLRWMVGDVIRSLPAQHLRAWSRGRRGVTRSAAGVVGAPERFDGGRGGGMDAITQDFRHAIRWFLKRPGFTAVAVITLTLGIGANSALFSIVNGILLRDLPYAEPDRLVTIWETHPSLSGARVASVPNVEDWAEGSATFEDIGIWRFWSRVMQGEDGAEGARGGLATPDFFRVLRLQPALGRLFLPEDLEPGRNHVVVLSHDIWASRFGRDPGVIGRIITMDAESWEIVGVLREGDEDPLMAGEGGHVELWTPLHFDPRSQERRSWRGFYAVGRLAPGASLSQARDELTALQGGLARVYPAIVGGWGVDMTTLHNRVVGSYRTTLLIFLGAVALVLLIACTNIANLLLAGVTGRRRELAVRSALGADRLRLIRLLLVEGFILSLLGGAGGLVLAWSGVDLFKALAPGGIPRLEQVTVDPLTLIFALALTLVTTLLFGLVPALSVSRNDLTSALKSDQRGQRGRAIGGLNGALVISEVALAMVLLIGTGLLVRSFTKLQGWEPGFEQEGILTFWLLPSGGKYETAEEVNALFQEAVAQMEAMPSVVSAATASAGPIFGGHEGGRFLTEGQEASVEADGHTVRWFDIGPGYFQTMGIPIVRGRPLVAADDRGAPLVAMVNESMARRLWPGEDPIGKRIRYDRTDDAPMEVVGVVADVQPFDPDDPVESVIYWPQNQWPRGATYVIVRSTSDPQALVRIAEERLKLLDPDMRIAAFRTMDQLVDRQLIRPRFNMSLVGMFGALALILSAVGIYGVVSRSVASRTREIGIRMALGAAQGKVLRGVVWEGMVLACLGVAAGFAIAIAASRLLTSMLHGVVPTDLPTYLSMSGILVLFTLGSCYLPARRASRVDPLDALREE